MTGCPAGLPSGSGPQAFQRRNLRHRTASWQMWAPTPGEAAPGFLCHGDGVTGAS